MTTGSNKEATVSTLIGVSLDPSLVEEGERDRRRFVDEVLGFAAPENLPIAFTPMPPLSGVLRVPAGRESTAFLTCDPLPMSVSRDSESVSESPSLEVSTIDPVDELSDIFPIKKATHLALVLNPISELMSPDLFYCHCFLLSRRQCPSLLQFDRNCGRTLYLTGSHPHFQQWVRGHFPNRFNIAHCRANASILSNGDRRTETVLRIIHANTF